MWKVLAAGFGRFSNIKRLLLALLLGFLAVAVIANSVLIVNRQEALGRVSRYNLTWLLSQAAHEVLRLEETISASALPGANIDADAVALRLDVLVNRLVLLRTGEAAEFIAERPDLKRNVEELEATLATIDKLVPGLPNPEVVLRIRNLLEPQVPRMLQLAAAANVRSGDIVAQDQHDLSFQHWLLTGLLVTAGLLIVVLLYRFASAQQRSRVELEREVSDRTAELRESLDYQTAISDVLKAISRSTFDLAPVLQAVVDTATRLCRAQMAGIYQFQEGTFRWVAGGGSGMDMLGASPAAPAWDDLVVRVAGGARTVSIANAAGESANSNGFGTMLGLPMTRDGQLIGVLAIARQAVEPFSAKQIELATVFADQAAIAIENVRLINEIREKGWQLERALQHKSQFLATMSHELRTPMNGVLGMIDVLEAEGPGKDQTHTLNMMRESAQVLLRNINDLLDYSRIEAGALRLEELPFVLKDLIDGAVEVFKPQATRKGLSLVGIVASSPADAFIGDPTRVRQVIFNLLSNALKFTDRGGVMLRASAEPIDNLMARVVLAVTDTGIGISAEQQARLFRPFSQVDSSITRRFGGSGLGLSIVKQLAELMQGDVTVSSLPGSGATFIVTLKLKPTVVEQPALPAPKAAAQPTQPAAAPAASNRKALVVDDNPINCEVMLRQLKVLGMPADSAADGFAGFSSWRSGGYDIVFADVHMPVMDGFTMTSEIRGIEKGESRKRTPIVAVTADAMAGEEERCKAAGMDDYLAKPVGLDGLRAALRRWLPEETEVPLPPVAAVKKAVRPADDTPAIDPTVLDPWVENDDDARRSILRRFSETVSASSHDLEQAMACGDLATLQSAAHRLRSGALAVGARLLSSTAAALETAAKTGDRVACEGQFGHLVVEMDRVRGQIDA
ncbi:MAG: response regulator [Reyranella sp.]|uniref:GAF domain-containing hybrid sensor histidine kinase/response regulator n=1 Tax=Reyranella sp. TaxID=1929291 RepID=UPI001AC41059|nr:ATP-binding protein [Reyranella sp.]MBN9090078.1 response regulator [Reyranella sp.]